LFKLQRKLIARRPIIFLIPFIFGPRPSIFERRRRYVRNAWAGWRNELHLPPLNFTPGMEL
jgi:hypothetical protein